MIRPVVVLWSYRKWSGCIWLVTLKTSPHFLFSARAAHSTRKKGKERIFSSQHLEVTLTPRSLTCPACNSSHWLPPTEPVSIDYRRQTTTTFHSFISAWSSQTLPDIEGQWAEAEKERSRAEEDRGSPLYPDTWCSSIALPLLIKLATKCGSYNNRASSSPNMFTDVAEGNGNK